MKQFTIVGEAETAEIGHCRSLTKRIDNKVEDGHVQKQKDNDNIDLSKL